MSEDALSRAERINGLLENWREAAAGTSQVPLQILGLVEENPYCTAKGVSEKLGIAFTTAQRGILRLEALDVLMQEGATRRNRVFCAERIMAILDEPAAFGPTQR
jgi:predicted HTH transcriptional regulator